MKLFFDTETTGLPNRGAPDGHESQPHIVQLAALLVDDKGEEKASIDLTIRPDGFTIPAEVAKIHGITQEIATRTGVALASAVSAFNQLVLLADEVIAHNIQFDLQLMRIAYARNQWTNRLDEGVQSGKHKFFCTCEMSRDLCRLPLSERQKATGQTGFKQPKLIEAYKIAFNKEFDNAHTALADVRACKEVYFWIKSREAAA